jgi:ATP-dependent Clp protease ATP-binding subunit ClpC
MERFTQRSRRILAFAQEEAEAAKSSEIETHHLLLGMLREEECIARHVLLEFDVDYKRAKKAVDAQNFRVPETVEVLDLSADIKNLLELAVQEARSFGHQYIGSEHLLLGMLRQTHSKALTVMDELDVKPLDVRKATIKLLNSRSDNEKTKLHPQHNPDMTFLDSLLEMLVSLWNAVLRLLGISKKK